MSDGRTAVSAPVTVANGLVKSKAPGAVDSKTSYVMFAGTETSSVAAFQVTPIVMAWRVVAAVQPPKTGGVTSAAGSAESSAVLVSMLPAASLARTTKKRGLVASASRVTDADSAPGAVVSVGVVKSSPPIVSLM